MLEQGLDEAFSLKMLTKDPHRLGVYYRADTHKTQKLAGSLSQRSESSTLGFSEMPVFWPHIENLQPCTIPLTGVLHKSFGKFKFRQIITKIR